MARSSEPGGSRRDGGRVRLVDYPRSAGRPTITVLRHAHLPAGPVPGTHAHDFLVLLYVEQGGGVLRVDGRDRTLHAGDAFVVAPGAVVTPHGGHGGARAWVVFFAADAVDPAAPPVSWRTHALLAPFGGTRGGGGRRLPVPPEERAAWLAHLDELEAELRDRGDGYAEAARAHLTLLLVRLARLHRDRADEPGAAPLVAAVLDVVEARYQEPISLRDVADAVGLTPGHLTTVIGRRTGRTVQQWITERRMREARRLLADTDLAVAEIAQRVGYAGAGYFVRRFRHEHGTTPATWRRAGRRPGLDADHPPPAELG